MKHSIINWAPLLVAIASKSTHGKLLLPEEQQSYPTREKLLHNHRPKNLLAKDELESLQVWLDNIVSSKNTIIGLSTSLAAGGSSSDVSPIHTVSSGKAVLSSAWDATNKKGITTSTEVPMSDSTTCMLASTSKLLTWTALSMMLDAGKFDLDDDINDALPFQVRNPRYPFAKVTYRHLYAHTSGIKDSWDGYFYGDACPADPMDPYPDSLTNTMKDGTSTNSNWYDFSPGEEHNYSNYGTAIGALLVEHHSG